MKVLLTLVPRFLITVMQTTTISASITAYSTAVGPSSLTRKLRTREKTPFKRFKITPDDWRNRGKWPAYERAVCDMVERTSTRLAPCTLVEANNKRYARVKVLKTLCDAIEKALENRR